MPVKGSGGDLEDAIRDYVSGDSIETVARRHHVGYQRLRGELKSRGLFRQGKARQSVAHAKSSVTRMGKNQVPAEEIVARYQSGESEKAIAASLGVSRNVIAARLRVAGVGRRGRTEAIQMSVSRATPETRERWREQGSRVLASLPRTLEWKCRVAQTRELRQLHTSPAEQLLHHWLAGRGVVGVMQKAIGPYNADIGIDPVAVEIFGGGWHGYGRHKRRSAERYRYILNQGWAVVVVWVDQWTYPLTPSVADYIVSFIEQSRGDPSIRGQYRVIRGDGQEVPTTGSDFNELTRKPTMR